jgi:hypothetical protein
VIWPGFPVILYSCRIDTVVHWKTPETKFTGKARNAEGQPV